MPDSGRETINTPIFFKTVEQFCSRPGYVLDLRCEKEDFDQIIGKYERPHNNQITCELNGCATMHMRGYIISTKDGRETNCGNTCGHREFGVAFKDVEARYLAAEDTERRRNMLDAVIKDRAEMIAIANSLQLEIAVAAECVAKIMAEVVKDPSLERALTGCLRDGGAIRVEDKTESPLPGSKGNLHTIATIRGGEAVYRHVTIVRAIRYDIIDPLYALDSADLATMTSKELAVKTLQLNTLSQAMVGARTFLNDARAFCSKQNLAEFEKLRQLMSSKNHTARLNRILDRLPALVDYGN